MMYSVKSFSVLLTLLIICGITVQQKAGFGSGSNGNLRVCVVEGKGLYKKAGRYCPILDKNNSGVECVIGTDRLDCLRRISKGKVDFGVFSSEDLLAARWQNIDVLVTDELRFHDAPFEYEVVAITENESGINSLEDLRGSRLCHPGHGNEADWTETLANFLEAKIIPRSCDPTLSLFENKLRASSEFFSGACKAGPWVADRTRDRTLKSLYPSLCSLCYDSSSCSTSDKYWGRRGPLHCLTEEIGDLAWARLDDTKVHFGLSEVVGIADPARYSYLCNDGTKEPLLNNTNPCVWIAKPWPVIAAKRKSSKSVSELASLLSHRDTSSWQSALLSLIEFYHVHVSPLQPQVPVQDYLQKATGFQTANSFAECTPPRSIVVCTKNIVERHKCDWLAETARAHGLEPQIQCLLKISNDTISNTTEDSSISLCFQALKEGIAEVTVANADWQVEAKSDYNLQPILYEMTPIMNDLHIVVAVVKKNSTIKTFNDMRAKRACFPKHNGVAWHSVIHYFSTQRLFEKAQCPFENEMEKFFESACVPGLHKDHQLTKLCGYREEYSGETGALKCLIDGKADVAFIRMSTLKNITDAAGPESWTHSVKSEDFRMICPHQNAQSCFISWSTIGQLYARSDASSMRKQELINTFKQLDQLFGKTYKSQTSAFTMYGPFDHKNNVLFQDKTKYMRTLSELVDNRLPFNFEVMMKEYQFDKCDVESAGVVNLNNLRGFCLLYVFLLFSLYDFLNFIFV